VIGIEKRPFDERKIVAAWFAGRGAS
jgi:hypothetical protein